MIDNFENACNSAEQFFQTFVFPNGERFKAVKKSEGKVRNTYSGKVLFESIEYLITLRISNPSMDSRLTVRPLIHLTEIERIKFAGVLPTIIQAVSNGTEVSKDGVSPDFSENIHHTEYSSDNIFDIRIGSLLTTAHTCTRALVGYLRHNRPMPTSSSLRQMCIHEFSAFCRKCLIAEPTKHQQDSDNKVSSEKMSDQEFEDFFNQWKLDVEKRRLNTKKLKSASDHSDHAWLRGTKFSTREKDILTIFKNNIK